MIFSEYVRDRKVRSFSLSPKFLEPFENKQPKWGPVGYVTYKRTYSRPLEGGGTEEWWQTTQRVVEGAFMIQKIHCRQLNLPWDESKAQKSARDMYQRIWDFKFLPPGRGLWMMGMPYVYKQGSAGLTNCSFISTDMITEDFAGPFCFLMDMSMMGVGVGSDTKGAGQVKIQMPKTTDNVFVVEDSREGWVALLRIILESFVGKGSYPTNIDYSKVRGAGVPIKGFGGLASGPKPLQILMERVVSVLMPDGVSISFDVEDLDVDLQTIGLVKTTFKGSGEHYPITSTHIVDVMNHIGCCVVAGNVRRSAEVIFGDPEDKEFMTLKQDSEALISHRWASNNSIFATVGMDYSEIVDVIAANGEPGLIWLDNARKYSRMNGVVDNKDARIKGFNPCVEQGLESTEACLNYYTKVLTKDGYQEIGSLSGQTVDVVSIYKKDNQLGHRNPSFCKAEVFCTGIKSTLIIETGDGKKVECSSNHPFMVTRDNVPSWVEAGKLKVADHLEGVLEGEPQAVFKCVVKSIEPGEDQPLFNMDVEGSHNYVAEGLVVHNCNLVETFPAHHESYEDYQATLKMAYLYAKTVTLVPTHNPKANAVMMRNRRIGCSMSGITQAMDKFGRREFLSKYCDKGYEYIRSLDTVYSEWLCVPKSIKVTTVKPSGSVSLLVGATPGIHPPHSEYYIRRIRMAQNSPLVDLCRNSGLSVVQDVYSDDTMVVEFPVHEKHFKKGKADMTVWEQFANVADLQKHWSDNAVSCLTGDTLIRTSVGTVYMRNLPEIMKSPKSTGVFDYKGALKVLNADNKWSSVSKLIVNPPKKLKKVVMEGLHTLSGTPDHEIQILGEDLNLHWVSLSNIKPGDYVVEMLNQKNYASSSSLLQRQLEKYKYPGRSDADKVQVPKRMSLKLAEFLGYMVSDGWLRNSTGRAFGLSQKANNVAERFEDLVYDLFGLDVKVNEDKRGLDKETPLLALVAYSTKVVHWLNWCGLYDEKSFKRVPWPIMSAGHMAVKAFLKGVTLDGHFSKDNGRIGVMSTNSEKITNELSVLLRQIGFQPLVTISAKENSGRKMVSPVNGKVYICNKPVWLVSLSATQSQRFMRMVGFAEDHKNVAYDVFGQKSRRHIFGCIPDFGLRDKMKNLSHRSLSKFFKDHWHTRSLHVGKRVSRETLCQMKDMGVSIPDHLISPERTFRKIIKIKDVKEQVTYDITVDEGHSYIANGFASHNCTISFKKHEKNDLKTCLETYEDSLKGISMLPLNDHGYELAPYESIDEATFHRLSKHLKPLILDSVGHEVDEKFCSNDSCELSFNKK